MHPKETLDHLKASVPLWVVAQDYCTLEERGGEYWGRCPFHEEKTASFAIDDKNGVWVYYCQGCGAKGDIFGFVQKLDSCSFDEAVKKVQKIGEKYETSGTVFKPIVGHDQTLSFTIDKLAAVENNLQSSGPAVAYLRSRGISLETAKRFHWGYVTHPPEDSIPTTHEWFDKGWLVFPTIVNGMVVSIKYRSIMGKVSPKGDRGFARKPGMMSPPPMTNLDEIDEMESVWVVEGELDMAVMTQIGVVAASIGGASMNITPEDKERLKKAPMRFLAGDSDSVGQVAMGKIWKDLKRNTYLIEWPRDNEGKQYKDANEVFQKMCNGDIDRFREVVLGLQRVSKQRPTPTVWSLQEILRNPQLGKRKDNPRALFWPWEPVNRWTSVLPGELMLLFASEPKTGKSTLLMNILIENALRGKTVLYYSAELTAQQYAIMSASYVTRQDREQIEPKHAMTAATILADTQFYIGYKPGATFKQVMEILKEEVKNLGADIVVIDPIHFLVRGAKDENAAMAEASRMLVDFAIENDVIMIAVGQPRKADANHRGRIARTSDIRGSASLGEDASSVWIMHRARKKKVQEGEDLYEAITTLNLDYSRNSASNSTQLYFHGSTCRFVTLAHGDNNETHSSTA